MGDGAQPGLSWPSVILLWTVPVAFALAAVGLSFDAARKTWTTVPAEAEVVHVYSWPSTAPWNRGQPEYAPLFRFVWSDGAATEATPGQRHADWNYAIGSRHEIRYFPEWKNNVVIPGAHNWMPGLALAGLAVLMAVPSWVLHRRLARRARAPR